MLHVLLTNDDGILAEGIQALKRALEKEYKVTVVAPSGQRSAAGHSISLRGTIRVDELAQGFAVDGTPADCEKIGLSMFAQDADVVVSGINNGANLGTDVHYSGTVSAAMEGAFSGKPAVAFSLHSRQFFDADYSAALCAKVLRAYLRNPLPFGTMLNVNLPNIETGEKPGIEVSPLGFQSFTPVYKRVGENEFQFDVSGKMRMNTAYSDLELVEKGNIVLTPITWDMTDHALLAHARDISFDLKDE